MTWWEWALLWTVLVLGAAAVLGWLAWGVLRAGLGLLEVLSTATSRLFDAVEAVEDLEADAARHLPTRSARPARPARSSPGSAPDVSGTSR